ncbi:dTDP-4-dehydrorhamnose reductase [Vibrio breoganii]|uniref:dTDP-4-dehydrorhamnose reductase n=1 Tax=Vibrio breoganii TaxID=553239 RepID=A0AAP8MSE2_9VIBR|nr:dTDP-4-dehydrorhamnose reductase [Vibrio breoganii]NMO74120.1 dTDP-4-dehydrorhamnose reductase [Vibrio breoganii]NMR70865.1 dTDP-4-dehydrorhamnose reductase [Vibrio breoganii]PMG02917.1 dTDP-4-dehydrorhamnose reductase [Vibrio breoganii]PML88181.1 dTDP-4-dehydrorhamnose reductase [Vibrio breoganii]PMP05674.1 dTDP-4-dehydrorhamnose reductase [Vibrio breoganii]
MRVLVTGCNGQVGHCLVNQLHNNVELLAVDREELDITSRDAVFTLVSEFKPDFIINAAAHTAVDKAEEEVDLSYAVNCDGPKYLAEAANNVGGTVLHISTDYVFPGNKQGVYSEEDKTGPLGVYGKSKLAGELALAGANERHIILRTAWVFGEHGNNFVKTMLRLGKDREALNIVGDQYGGPTYAGDIAQALIAIMNKASADDDSSLYGVYHFSGAPHVSWYEFAQEIFQQAETKQLLKAPTLTSITTDMYPTPAVRPENSKMNCDKIQHNFGIEPSDWQAALENIKGYMA